MSVPDEVKWVTHRPVILAAPDWPEMVELKAHAASLGADVEVSPLVQSKHVRIVWVPTGFVGSAASQLQSQHVELLTGGFAEVAQGMRQLSAGIAQAAETFRKLAEGAREDQ